LSGRRGKKRAVPAVAHTLLTVGCHTLKSSGLELRDPGGDFFDQRDARSTASRLAGRLEKPGYKVALASKAA
jgi:transposase